MTDNFDEDDRYTKRKQKSDKYYKRKRKERHQPRKHNPHRRKHEDAPTVEEALEEAYEEQLRDFEDLTDFLDSFVSC